MAGAHKEVGTPEMMPSTRIRHMENTIQYGTFIPTFQCPHRVQRVGINSESLFESTLLKRGPGCEVGDMTILLTAFVPSPPCLYPTELDMWPVPEITGDPELRDRAHFKPFALGGTNNHEDHDNPKYWTLDSFMDLHGVRARPPLLHEER
ncbi:hypothetical protein EDB89DRAFT_1908896 [Lactarius sanguifluus]|nr:hypothetical protein EDB89DRAFT_1908896 [Lactarius sanguifluus]